VRGERKPQASKAHIEETEMAKLIDPIDLVTLGEYIDAMYDPNENRVEAVKDYLWYKEGIKKLYDLTEDEFERIAAPFKKKRA
jgi:hypothetical protein